MSAILNAEGVALAAELYRQWLTMQSLVIQANAENRQLTRAELDAATKPMDDADAKLDSEIARAEAENR